MFCNYFMSSSVLSHTILSFHLVLVCAFSVGKSRVRVCSSIGHGIGKEIGDWLSHNVIMSRTSLETPDLKPNKL